MPRDNISVRDYWMLMQETATGMEVVIVRQKVGEASTAEIHVPKAIFAAMVDWFNTGVLKKRPGSSPEGDA